MLLEWMAVFLLLGQGGPQESLVRVRTAQELRRAVEQAKPGTRILIEAGEYPGGFYFVNLRGEPGKPIVLAAADPQSPPLFRGGGEGMHLVDPAYVELHHLAFLGASSNGLNIDDGGSYDTPAHHMVLKGLRVAEVGPQGNRDGIKLSGVDDFRIEDCLIERWGDGGQGIDMVGCHRGVIEGCTLRFEEGKGYGVQAKGGSSQILIRRCRFEHAGHRAVNLGGSTGLQFFRPPLKKGEEHAEARDITVEGCTFIGALAPIAFVGVDGAKVRFNTLYRPRRWALRILQETTAEGFVPCRRGEFTDNIVVFRSDEWFEGGVNIGPHTAPQTFRFARNFWYCLDRPERSRPSLPVEEQEGVYGKDPLLRDPERGDLRLRPESPARRAGADALPQGERAPNR